MGDGGRIDRQALLSLTHPVLVTVHCVVVDASQSGDWYLGGFELMTAASSSVSDWPSAHFREHDEVVDVRYGACLASTSPSECFAYLGCEL